MEINVDGKVVVLLGTFSTLTRAQAKAGLVGFKAKVSETVSGKTDSVFAGTGADPVKVKRAEDFDRPVYSEKELVALLATEPPAEDRSKESASMAFGGLSLASRLDLWVRVFSRRSDVVVTEHRRGKPWKGAPKSIFAPGQIDEFYTENNGYVLNWKLRDAPMDLQTTNILNIVSHNGTHVLWYEDSGSRPFAKYRHAMMFDAVANENNTCVVKREVEGKKDPVVTLEVDDQVWGRPVKTFPTLEAYLTEGARKAFTWYWQSNSTREGEAVLQALRSRSIPRETPRAEVEARLVQQEISPEEAAALYDWLGQDTTLLLEIQA